MAATTRLGDGWAWLAVLITMPARHDHGEAHVLAEALIAAAAVNAAQVALKRTFRRRRPATAASRRAVFAPDQFSFPSGHTMNVFAVAVLVSARVPAASPAALVIASSVGASRVVLGLHIRATWRRGRCWARWLPAQWCSSSADRTCGPDRKSVV